MMLRRIRWAARLGVAVLVVAAGLGWLGPRPVAAQATGWSPPRELSLPPADSAGWLPTIAADPYGDLHVVWNGAAAVPPGGSASPTLNGPQRLSDDSSWLYYTGWDGHRWSTPTDIEATSPASVALRSSLAATPTGRLYLFYRGMDLQNPASGSMESLRLSTASALDAGSADAWSPGVQLSDRIPTYFPDLVVDHHGTLHAIWTEYDGLSGYGIYYSHSTDGGKTWSPRIILESLRPVYWFRLQLRVGPRDDLHAVWEVLDPPDALSWAAPTPGFVYAQSTDGGKTWQKTPFIPEENAGARMGRFSERISSPPSWPVEPALGIDGSGRIMLVWRDVSTNAIDYQWSRDGVVWTRPAPIPGVAAGVPRPFDHYDLATDSAGHLHLVLVGYPTGSDTMTLLHSEWNGETWSPADAIVSAPPYPEYPSIVVSEGNRLNVVWFSGDVATVDRTPVGVYYSFAHSSAPYEKPLPKPARPVTGGTALLPTPMPTVAASIPTATAGNSVTSILAGAPAQSPTSAPGVAIPGTTRPVLAGLGMSALLVGCALGIQRRRWLG
jgi:hypothetical protein